MEHCGFFDAFVRRRVEDEGDEDLRDAQALLVIWPGLRAPGSYMLTCGYVRGWLCVMLGGSDA